MRNRFPGTCYRCGGHVAKGGGHFEPVSYTHLTLPTILLV